MTAEPTRATDIGEPIEEGEIIVVPDRLPVAPLPEREPEQVPA